MKPIDSLRAVISRHRVSISRHVAERAAALSAPVDAATVTARIDAEIAAGQERAGKFFSFIGSPRNEFSPGRFNEHMKNDAFAFFASFDPERVREMALEKVGPTGLTGEERAKRLAYAEAALAEAEIAEELALRELDALVGAHEPRRLDAKPPILLAPLAELQAAKPAKMIAFSKKAG